MPTEPNPTPDTPHVPHADYTPFYAVAGLADVIAEALRATLAERQERAAARFAALREKAPDPEVVKLDADELREFLATLPEQVRSLPESTRVRLAELQQQAEDLLAQAGNTYATLAGRGKRVVGQRVSAVRSASTRARATAEEKAADAAEAV